jgi:hypothetical protein
MKYISKADIRYNLKAICSGKLLMAEYHDGNQYFHQALVANWGIFHLLMTEIMLSMDWLTGFRVG